MSQKSSSNGNTGHTQQDIQSWILNIIMDTPPPKEGSTPKK